MDCIAIVDSGNYAFSLCRIMEKKGYVFEVITTPCRIAKSGCGYCIKLPYELKDVLIEEGARNHIPVREIYTIEKLATKNKYAKVL